MNIMAENNNQPTTSAIAQEKHDYDKRADLFASAVGFEKSSIIAPAIRHEFNTLVTKTHFDKACDKIIDIGCGPFLLSLPFLRDGIHVDGLDPSTEMLSIAKQAIEDAAPNLTSDAVQLLNDDKIKLVSEYEDLKENSYQLAMLNFVHQCAPSVKSLNTLFNKASTLLQEDGRLIMTGAHPDYLYDPHACCEYDISNKKTNANLQNGELYSGHIYNEMGAKTYELHGDHFWSLDKLQSAAKQAGFETKGLVDINDKETTMRRASKTPAYFIMTFKKS